MKLIYFAIVISAAHGVTQTVLKYLNVGLISDIYIDYLIVLFFFANLEMIKRRKIYMLFFIYMGMGLLLISLNIILNWRQDFTVFIRYASFYRRSVLPLMLVFIFIELLNDKEKIVRLNNFLYNFFKIIVYIQCADFILFHFYSPYNEFVRHLITFQEKFQMVDITPNNFIWGFHGLTIQRPQGFMLNMHPSNLFCLLLFGYLRTIGKPFSFWERILAAIACLSGLSKLNFMLYASMETCLFISSRKPSIAGSRSQHLENKYNIIRSTSINLFPFICLLIVAIPYCIYVFQIQPFFDFENKFGYLGFVISLHRALLYAFNNMEIIDLIGRGGHHLFGIYNELEKNIGDVEIIRFLFEGGLINFLFWILTFIVMPPWIENRAKLYFRHVPFFHRIFNAAKFSIFIGIMSLLHSLAIFSRELVFLYMVLYALCYSSYLLARKDYIKSKDHL